MAGTFSAGLDRFEEQFGTGTIVASSTVDQVYAKYQHERADLSHPRGGIAFYLRDPMFANVGNDLAYIASKVITSGGSELRSAMKDYAEGLAAYVYVNAPLEYADLKGSGDSRVEDPSGYAYYRPPNVSRLSEDEINAKRAVSRLFGPGGGL